MSIESFSYTLLTAGVGMGLVFLFLGALSLLMLVIRIAFDRKPRTAADTANGSASRSTPETPPWAIVAAVAYLMEEANDSIPHAQHWVDAR